MNLLLDTHILLWFLWDDPKLSKAAKLLIEDPANHKFVSVASCWEIAIKCSVGKLKLGEPSQSFLNRELSRTTLICCPSASIMRRASNRCPCIIVIRSTGC
jgi:PIN domain nuclease of toxin-antitoxin system